MATQRRNALGRGLDALLSMDEVKTEGSSSINEIELSQISVNPNQPRREFDETALQELSDSISEIGIIQPITLRKLTEDEYQIIAGERRYIRCCVKIKNWHRLFSFLYILTLSCIIIVLTALV